MIKILVTIFLNTVFSAVVFSSTYNIKGRIMSSCTKNSIAYASIQVLNNGVYSDANGYFEILNVNADSVIIKVSSIGFESNVRTIKLSSDVSNLIIRMKPLSYNLNQVVCTASLNSRALADTPILTKLINSDQIQRMAAASLSDVLEFSVPGLSFTPDPHGMNMTMQGLSNKHVLILIDGERMVSEKRGNVNINRLNVDDIKQIEIVNGALSTLYGSNAVGGVINIITKDACKPIGITVNNQFASNNTIQSRANVSCKREIADLNVSLFRNSSDGFDKSPEVPESREMKRYVEYGVAMKLNTKINDNIKARFKANYYTHEDFNPDRDFTPYRPLGVNYNLGANISHVNTSKNNSISATFNKDVFVEHTFYEKLDTKIKKAHNQYSSLKLLNSHDFNENINLIIGADVNRESVFSLNTLGSNACTKSVSSWASFMQMSYKVCDNVNIAPGVRYTDNSGFGSNITSQISCMYSLDRFKFRVNTGSSYRAPSLKEMYYDFNHQAMFHIYGNPDLKPEKGVYSSFSTEYTYNTFNMSVNIYNNSIRDKILMYDVQNASVNEKRHANIARTSYRGIETSLSVLVHNALRVNLSYSYSDAKDKTTNTQVFGNSYHSGVLGFSYTSSHLFNRTLSLSYSGRLSSPKQWYKVNFNTGELDRISSKSFSVWMLNINKSFRINNKEMFKLYFKINNLYNFKDESFIDAGRTFLLGLKFTY